MKRQPISDHDLSMLPNYVFDIVKGLGQSKDLRVHFSMKRYIINLQMYSGLLLDDMQMLGNNPKVMGVGEIGYPYLQIYVKET